MSEKRATIRIEHVNIEAGYPDNEETITRIEVVAKGLDTAESLLLASSLAEWTTLLEAEANNEEPDPPPASSAAQPQAPAANVEQPQQSEQPKKRGPGRPRKERHENLQPAVVGTAAAPAETKTDERQLDIEDAIANSSPPARIETATAVTENVLDSEVISPAITSEGANYIPPHEEKQPTSEDLAHEAAFEAENRRVDQVMSGFGAEIERIRSDEAIHDAVSIWLCAKEDFQKAGAGDSVLSIARSLLVEKVSELLKMSEDSAANLLGEAIKRARQNVAKSEPITVKAEAVEVVKPSEPAALTGEEKFIADLKNAKSLSEAIKVVVRGKFAGMPTAKTDSVLGCINQYKGVNPLLDNPPSSFRAVVMVVARTCGLALT